MAEEQPEADDGISTVNTNARLIKDQRQADFEEGERMLIFTGVESVRDVVVLANRIEDEYAGITGMELVEETTLIVYCDRF